MTRAKPSGFMPNQAAHLLVKSVSERAARNVHVSVKLGVTPESERRLAELRLTFARLDAFHALLDKAGEMMGEG